MRHYAFAAAMGLLTAAVLAPSSQSQAASADPTGYWMKPDAERESKIQVFKCGKAKSMLCAKIIWLKEPNDSRGKPLHDIRNESPSMRGRSIVGLTIFSGLAPSAPSTWTGKIYNPEDGHTYSATLTVLSRKQILLKGCKAWLLCGEKQWLRTSAPPEELTPTAPSEGAQQIEASVTPQNPPSASSNAEAVAAAEPAAAVLVTQEIVAAAAPPADYHARRGYGFLNVSAGPETAARLSGENVSSMFVMTKPIATDAVAPKAAAVQGAEPVAIPEQKSKAKLIATAAAKPAPKTVTPAKPTEQGAPAPQDTDTAQADVDGEDASQSETAEAAMVEPVPLSRRQRRAMRRQQQDPDPFLPWLR